MLKLIRKFRLLLVFILLASSQFVFSQEKIKELTTPLPLNSINLHMGDASLISLDYERLFGFKNNVFFAGKIGVGYNEEFKLCFSGGCNTPRENYTTIPHHITANFGKSKHYLEVGLGGTYISGTIDRNYWVYPIFGYRFQPSKPKKLNFRVFVCIPFDGFSTKDILFMPVGFSTGYVF